MPNILSNKKQCSVVVLESASTVRMMICEVIRDLGYEKVTSFGSSQEALHFFETEKVHWLISTSMMKENINALHLLKIIAQAPQLNGLYTSLLIDPSSEESLLPKAFELGLLSFHPKSYIKENIQSEFEDLLNLLDVNQWDPTLASAEYLRSILDRSKLHESRFALEENMLDLYPGNVTALLNFAEAQFGLNLIDKAEATLEQALLLDPSVQSNCKRIRQKYLGFSEVKGDKSGTKTNVLGIRSCLVIDPDTDVLHNIKGLLEAIGLTNIATFETGDGALDYLRSSKPPELIISEWRIPGITGPVLLQRIRQIGLIHIPIITISSLLKPEDEPLLREFGVDRLILKPFGPQDFYGAIIWAIQQHRHPKEQKSMALKIRRLLGTEKLGEAQRLIAQFFADPNISDGAKKEIEAEYEYCQGHYERARDIGMAAIELGGDSLLLLNLIGKSMLHLREFESALKCFEKAQSISPLNVDRLLLIAETNIGLNNVGKAHEAIEAAKQLDGSNESVKEVDYHLQLKQGNIGTARNILESVELGAKFPAFMNNRAVALARNGKYEEGISLYEKTIESIPDSWNHIRSQVTYNLGLALAKYGDLDKAKEILGIISSRNDPRCYLKASSLIKRIEMSKKTGRRLVFSDENSHENGDYVEITEPNSSEIKTSFLSLMDQIPVFELKRGEFCCYFLFRVIDDHPESKKLDEALKRLPVFMKREAIKRSV